MNSIQETHAKIFEAERGREQGHRTDINLSAGCGVTENISGAETRRGT
jgi:hypothetical protein